MDKSRIIRDSCISRNHIMLLYVNQIKFGTKRSEVRIFSPRPDWDRVFGINENPVFYISLHIYSI